MRQVSDEDGQAFWAEVQDAVSRLAADQGLERDACKRMNETREQVEQLAEDEHDSFYHADPFDIAIDLVGLDPERALRAHEIARRRSAAHP